MGKVLNINSLKRTPEFFENLTQLINGFSNKFEVKTKLLDSSFQVQLRQVDLVNSEILPLHITLRIHLDRSSYELECFKVRNGTKSEEDISRLHSIKVDGPWTLKSLEADLSKFVKREFKTFRPRYYPF